MDPDSEQVVLSEEFASAAHRAGSDLSADFHVYGIDWDASQITWLLDGRPYHRMTPAEAPGSVWPFRHPYFLVVNLAVGGAWPGNDTETPVLPATLLVDWIRVRAAPATPVTP
ncbi:MAG: glycoside hydrolase family 16 protein [Ilumatobacteraceae bacterium]